jgi:hypothetical protein
MLIGVGQHLVAGMGGWGVLRYVFRVTTPSLVRISPMPFKTLAARRHYIPKQRHRVTNWPAYDANLRGREV